MKYVTGTRTVNPQTTVVTCQGEMDTLAVEEMRQAVEPLLSDTVSNLVFDLAAVEYVSSSVLSFLLATQSKAQEKGGKVSLVAASDLVKQVFEMAALDGLFRFYGTLEDAGVAVTPPASAKGKERTERKGKGTTTKVAKPSMRVVEEKASSPRDTEEQEEEEPPSTKRERRATREVEKIQPMAEPKSWRDYAVWIGIGALVVMSVAVSLYLYLIWQ